MTQITPPHVHLRRATPADAALLRQWDRKPHVMFATGADAANGDGGWDWEHELARQVSWQEILIAEADRRPVGVLQIIDPETEETHYWGDVGDGLRAIDIWIGEEEDLGRGYGTRMMHLALARCFADPGVQAVLIDPLAINTRAHRFYERLGFRLIDRRMFGADDCYVYRLDRPA